MNTPENSESTPKDQFNDIVAGLEIKPEANFETQVEIFNEIKRRHEAARQEADITRVAVDRLPLEAIGTGVEISLRRVKPDPETESLFLRVNYPIKSDESSTPVTHNIFLTIGKRSDGKVIESNEFNNDQANLVFDQADELLSLKAEGFLPNLTDDLGTIFNINTAIAMYHPPTPKEQ